MYINDATELAYKNGYEAGYKDGYEARNENNLKENEHKILFAHWKKGAFDSYYCSECGVYVNSMQEKCPSCRAQMTNFISGSENI